MGRKVVMVAGPVNLVGGVNYGPLVGLCMLMLVTASAVLAIALANYSLVAQDVQRLQTQGVRTNATDMWTGVAEVDHRQVPYVAYDFNAKDSDGQLQAYKGTRNIDWDLYGALQHGKRAQVIYVPKTPGLSDVVGNDPLEARGGGGLMHWIIGCVVLILLSLGLGIPLLVAMLKPPSESAALPPAP